MRSITICFFALVSLAAPAVFGAEVLKPCEIPGIKGPAKCGQVEVWENRETKSGRRIGLKVVVLPATGSPRASDAITVLGGGPGEAITEEAPYFAREFAALREHRDLLFVDQRGTGGSHDLECDLYPSKDPQTALGAFFPAERVRECRALLEKQADLRMYTTAPAADDLDEVRGILGYDRLDLFGGSYGTRAALTFLRRHPDRVRVAVLEGVVPPTKPAPLEFPQSAQQAVERIFDECAADAACHAAFPDLRADLRAIVAKTAAKPVAVDILNPKNGETVHVMLSRNLLGEAIRYLMYQSATGLYVPALVHQAATGDFAPLAEFALVSRLQLVNGLGQGLYLSVTCSEDLPFVTPDAAARQAANTFLGDYRYTDQRAACNEWARGPVPAHMREPVRAQAPVLLISGSWDPVTPARDAEEVAATLPHSLRVVIPAGGHGYGGIPGADACVASIVGRFVERGSTEGVDTACVRALRRPPFPTKPVDTKPVALTAEQLRALTGHFAGEGVPPVEVVVKNGKLFGQVAGDPDPLLLVPVSATRMRLLGRFGSALQFDVENGKAVGMTLQGAGGRTMVWKRSG
ncbi:MAG TPA: alpha/beta fold hydrolase [Thermoanaerobaculia bacterium]|jgi:pimeloyl-ACP methyl ester carboxylesterase